MDFFKKKFNKIVDSVNDFIDYLDESIEVNLFKKYTTLQKTYRFVISWILLVLILITVIFIQNFQLNSFYQYDKYISGGAFSLGVKGLFTNANPIYATSTVDSLVSHMLFAGLFKYDSHNNLVGDLASSYSVDSTGRVYTIKLKPNLSWQDGKPITSADVAFTYRLIEDPNSQSPYASSFANVLISTPNSSTVVFTLPDILAPFIYSLTIGILPQHVLSSIPSVDMRSVLFNTSNPIGSGPFMWQGIEETGNDPTNAETQINFIPNPRYYAGPPQLSEFILKSYPTQSDVATAFNKNQIFAAIGLDNTSSIGLGYKSYSFIYTAGTYVFLKTSSGVLSDQNVRKALLEATNQNSVMTSLGYPTLEVTEPLLIGQLAFQRDYRQYGYNLADANNVLTKDGYIMSKDGYRYKGSQPLAFNLTVLNTDAALANLIKSQWRAVGANVTIVAQDPNSFDLTLRYHQYDALINTISIGVDPDVFVYWDSSQLSSQPIGNLNFSEFNNSSANESIEEGRTRLDPALRVIKYRQFLQAWHDQVPAIGLYQPRLLLISHSKINNLNEKIINSAQDVLSNVNDWQINTVRQTL